MTARLAGALLVTLILVPAASAADFKLRLPLGLQEQAVYVPDDNPLTSEKIALAKQLFWDKRWSRNGTVACVSCHDPNHGWADPRQFSLRFDGKPTPRHSPTLVNRLFSDVQQWVGTRDSLEDDLGRHTVTKREEHKGAFKTPTLRDVARRPPYMHDGSLQTLGDVIAFYNRSGTPNPWLSGDIRPLGLTPEEQADLVALLQALTGEVAAEVSSPPHLPQ